MVLSILANGKVIQGMVKVHKSGQMELCTRVSGKMIWPMGRELFCMYQETNTKVNGSEIRLMEKEFTLIATVQSMMEIGKMIYSTDSVQRPGMTIHSIRVNIIKERNMESELTLGKMVQHTQESGRKIKLMAKANTHGTTGECMRVTGKIIIWMVTDATYGKMDVNMKDST